MDLAWEFASMQLVHEALDPKQPIPMFEIEVQIRTPLKLLKKVKITCLCPHPWQKVTSPTGSASQRQLNKLDKLETTKLTSSAGQRKLTKLDQSRG